MFTYDVSTDLGKIRLLITDRDDANATFQDEEIAAIYALCDSSVRMTAAQLLESIAVNEVLVQKRIETLSLKTDGPREAEALKEFAKTLREQENLADGGFDIAEMVYNSFGARERLYKQFQRGIL